MSPTTWFKVDDGLAFHPKAVAAGNAALGLWLRAGAWCAGNLTDGRLPRAIIAPLDGRKRDADRLVEAGLWRRTEQGYEFVDWDQWQPTKEQVRAERAATRQRVERWREGRRNGVTERVTNGVSNGVGTPAPSRPVPSRSGLGSQSPNGSHPSRSSDDRPDRPDLAKIAAELGQPEVWASRVVTDVLTRASRPPGDVTAYVLSAIRAEPSRYQPTQGPPPLDRLCDHGRDRLVCRDCEKGQS